jgi:predicted DNA-binding transcriptional regulator YafY
MRADRLLSIVMLLQTHGRMTTAQLATALEVSRRTVLRDIEALSIAGVPIYADGGHGGGVALDEGYRTTLTGLQESEVRALFVTGGQQLLGQLGLGEAAETMRLKLSAALPAQHQAAIDHMRQRVYIDPLWWWHEDGEQPFWAELQEAVYADRCVRVAYENYQGETAQRTLEPYSLVAKSGAWYVVARRDGTFKTYRASRIRQLELLDEQFARDAAFDLVTYWHEHLAEFVSEFSHYVFTLRVHPDRVAFVRWLMPGRIQVLSTGDDGWEMLRCQIDSVELAIMIVFGLGADGEIVDPPELKDAVLRASEDMLARLSQVRPIHTRHRPEADASG